MREIIEALTVFVLALVIWKTGGEASPRQRRMLNRRNRPPSGRVHEEDDHPDGTPGDPPFAF